VEIGFEPGWLCVLYASHRSLDKHLSDRSLWSDCHSVGRKPGNIRRSFAGRTLEKKPNNFVSFGFVLCRLGFVRGHRVSDDGCRTHGCHRCFRRVSRWSAQRRPALNSLRSLGRLLAPGTMPDNPQPATGRRLSWGTPSSCSRPRAGLHALLAVADPQDLGAAPPTTAVMSGAGMPIAPPSAASSTAGCASVCVRETSPLPASSYASNGAPC